jgi:polar amino acid transport system substrate-binding protein
VNRKAVRPLLALLATTALMSACAPSDDNTEATTSKTPSTSQSSSPSATADACAKASLQTQTPGTLTIATDQPAYPPWFDNDKPENGKGYEGAVAAAVAAKLGFTPEEVKWTRVQFNNVFKPTPKNWDFDINEISITDERKAAIDFSSPYYDVAQAVVTTKGSKAAHAKTLADLKGLTIGAQVGTTSLDAINNIIAPSKSPRVYNSNHDVISALKNGQIDALVTDLPTAFEMSAVQLSNAGGRIIGQLPSVGGTPEQFGLALEKNSPLTTCVTKAVDALRQDGVFDTLVDKWLSQGGAPVLQ